MFRRIHRRWKMIFRGEEFRRELDEEMDFHIQKLIEDLVRGGMDPREARRQAHIRFGSREGVQARSREIGGVALLDEALRNFRFALRSMVRSPLFSGTFILTLGLCIGLGTAVFSVVDAVLWKPLPYPAPDRLAHAVLYNPAYGKQPGQTSVDGLTWERIRDEATFLDRAVYSGWIRGVNLATDQAAAFVQQQRIGAGYFRTLGTAPALGREFTRAEAAPGGPAVALLSHDLWTGTFGADPDIVGSSIRLKGEAHTVLGVMPRDFRSHADADVWTPLRPSTTGEGGGTNYAVLVRLPAGMNMAEADTRLGAIDPQRPNGGDQATRRRFGVIPLDEALTAGMRFPMMVLLGAIGFMLLVGCANLAGLQIARSLARGEEMATRQALGSGSAALVRQMVAENLLLGLLGGLLGLGVAYLGVQGLEGLVRTHFHTWQEIHLDGRGLAAAGGITLMATLLFGLAPVIQVMNPNIRQVLVSGTRVVGGGGHLVRKSLLVGQVAMVSVLLFSAGLLVRSYGWLEGLEPGFDPEEVLTVQLSLDDARYAEAENVHRLFRETQAALDAIPSVTASSVSLTLPYERPLNLGFRFPDDGEDVYNITNAVYVTEGFFETLDIPLSQGRVLTPADQAGSPTVAVANQAWVDTYLEGRSAVGTRIHIGFAGAEGLEIVGVVGNVLQQAVWGEHPAPVWGTPTLYLPASQAANGFMRQVHVWFSPSWMVRSRDPGRDLAQQVIWAIHSVDPGLPTARVAPLEEVMAEAFARQRFEAAFLLVVAGFALILAGIGLYGIVAHEVLERRSEMGLRMALGATPSAAIWKAGASGVRLSVMGLVLGAGLAVVAGRLMVALIYGITPYDPMAILAILAVLALFTGLSSFVPAARVGRMDPAEILREG